MYSEHHDSNDIKIELNQNKLECTCTKILIVDDNNFNLFSLENLLYHHFSLTCDKVIPFIHSIYRHIKDYRLLT